MTYKGTTLVTNEGDINQCEGVGAFVVPGREISRERKISDVWLTHLVETLL